MRKPSEDMAQFRELLSSSKRIIAVAGAGLSAASGIPTFRGAGGFWRKFDAIKLATPESFECNPSRVWQFYHYRREAVLKVKPNAAHKALAQFSIQENRDKLMPSNVGSSFTLITQNVDGLSVATLKSAVGKTQDVVYNASPQPPILEMHGRLFDVTCTSCDHVSYNMNSPIVPALAGTEKNIEDTQGEVLIPVNDLPRCESCGALARPGVVWFGERPKFLDEIDYLVESCDLCIVVGTSSTVYPAAGYAHQVRKRGGKVAVFNLEETIGDDRAQFRFIGPCEETLPKALGLQL